MKLGPYITQDNKIAYRGNKVRKGLSEVRNIKPRGLEKRHIELKHDARYWPAAMKIWDGTYQSVNEFMKSDKALLFDLPVTTRMISSPGALTGTIPSDVHPFRIKMFGKEVFLTQSSQFYLEFAITNPAVKKTYCWEKSFRRERADFRHLPEFHHIEYEARGNLKSIIDTQTRFIQYLIAYLLKHHRRDLSVFLDAAEIRNLQKLSQLKKFEQITFEDAFAKLYEATGLLRYRKPSIKHFTAYEEILLTEIIGKPVFVTHYISDEVAFYHQNDPRNKKLVLNADFLYPGYGELIGSGERIHTRDQIRKKARHFELNMKDYKPYIESRSVSGVTVHSGFGMGMERFVQAVLHLPFIWDAKPFARVDGFNYP